MSSLATQIERYLKRQLKQSEAGFIEVQRSDLAEIFMCVPSQINYVLATRFNNESGYIVESRRGGGGYVRIIKVALDEDEELTKLLNNSVKRPTSQEAADKLLNRLSEEGLLSKREADIVKLLLANTNMQLEREEADYLRSRLLRVLLLNLLREDF